MANDVPEKPMPSAASDADSIPKPEVSATARNAARRNAKGKKRQGRNNRGKLVAETRLEMVVRLLDSFEEPPYIQRAVAHAFNCSERTVREDITRVEAERASERELDAYEERLIYKRALLTQVRVCLREGNKSEARRFFDMLIRIGGHYAPDALKVFQMEYGDLGRLSEEQLDQMERDYWNKFGPPTGRMLPPAPTASPPPASTPNAAGSSVTVVSAPPASAVQAGPHSQASDPTSADARIPGSTSSNPTIPTQYTDTVISTDAAPHGGQAEGDPAESRQEETHASEDEGAAAGGEEATRDEGAEADHDRGP